MTFIVFYIDGEMDKSDYEIAKERYKDIYDELKQLEIAAIDEKEILQLYKKADSLIGPSESINYILELIKEETEKEK